MRALTLSTLALLACTGKDGVPLDDTGGASGDDSAVNTDDTSVADDTGATDDTGTTQLPDDMRELSELSSGECPDLSQLGATTTSQFLSSGESRTVTAVLPNQVSANTQVVFFFHGLMSPDQTPDPTEYMATALQLQQVANQLDAIILLPESPTRTEFGFSFFLWDVEGNTDHDIVLFDDLRTCVADLLAPDLERLSIVGFSGGALFTTMVASQRGDAISTMVEMSGGADLEVIISPSIVAAYETPAWTFGALLVTGGTNDVWPDPNFAIVDFVAGTDTLETNLVDDGHFVVRCRHNQGHTITNDEYALALEWLNSHHFGELSPYETNGLGTHSSWCEVVGDAE
ncbi:MAG: hypothetical protein H6739_14070 [Alphaproteobacteria bacterium]|nr:hypothetical protein [Alphaproteobacteria bacterium]